jgi:RNA polymerase sigma-B factor
MHGEPRCNASDVADERDLDALHERADEAARARLIERYLPLVRRLAWRYRGSGEPIEDLAQSGSLGLVKAIDRFDPARGTPLPAYVVLMVLGEIRRHLRDRGGGATVPRPVRELGARLRAIGDDLGASLGRTPTIAELASAADVDAESVLDALLATNARLTVPFFETPGDGPKASAPPDALASIDGRLALVEDRTAAAQGLRALDGRERTIVALSFFDGLSQSQIAGRLGISQMHVSRLLGRALAKAHAAATDMSAPAAGVRS